MDKEIEVLALFAVLVPLFYYGRWLLRKFPFREHRTNWLLAIAFWIWIVMSMPT